MNFKRQAMSQQGNQDIKPWESYHNTSLQDSKFITLDHDMRHLKKVFRHSLTNGSQDKKNEVVPRFCPQKEVDKKNDQKLVFKGAFLAKILNLKQNGQKTQVMTRVNEWISENLESLYQKNNQKVRGSSKNIIQNI